MDLADEVLDHFFGDFEVGDHAIAKGPNGFHVTRCSAQHLLGIDAHGVDDLATANIAQGNHRRLIQHNALTLHVNQGVGGAKVYGDVVRDGAEEGRNHDGP